MARPGTRLQAHLVGAQADPDSGFECRHDPGGRVAQTTRPPDRRVARQAMRLAESPVSKSRSPPTSDPGPGRDVRASPLLASEPPGSGTLARWMPG